jgi:hypothetical protein
MENIIFVRKNKFVRKKNTMKYGWKKNWKKKEHQLGLGIREQFFFSQFCDVNKVAIIHKTIHPDLAIQKHETKFSLKRVNSGYI